MDMDAYRCNPAKRKFRGGAPFLRRILSSLGLPAHVEDSAWQYLYALEVPITEVRGRLVVPQDWEPFARECLRASTEFGQALLCSGALSGLQGSTDGRVRNPSADQDAEDEETNDDHEEDVEDVEEEEDDD